MPDGAGHDDQVQYFTAMRDALRASGRHIVYSINPNSSGDPEPAWPTTGRISPTSPRATPSTWFPRGAMPRVVAEGLAGVSQAFGQSGPLAPQSKPSHVNDPDMLVVGVGWYQFVVGHPTMALRCAAA